MKNRASSHLLILLAIIAVEIVGYIAVGRAAAIRGYEPSMVGAVRDILLYLPLVVLVFWLSRVKRYAGSWTLYTVAILLFSIGLLVQYRLFSDPEYGARNRAQARAEKTQVLRERYVNQFYDAEKKRMLGITESPANVNQDAEEVRRSGFTFSGALTSSFTWIPLLAFLALAVAYSLAVRDDVLRWLQRHSFIIVIATLIPFTVTVAFSSFGKVGSMTPWEIFKIPLLVGFAGILTALYRNLAQTYWGIPRARDIVPLIVMAMMPFIPFFALKDFGQMMVFAGAYATLYLVAVRRPVQLLLFVGSVAFIIGVLVVGALPRETQEKVPLLPTLASPIKAALPARIQQRFHLWLDGFNPPPTDTDWWKGDYQDALARDVKMRELATESPAMRRTVNTDIWFDRIAFQPSQATFGIVSGGMTGRGLGLGFSEVIPVADSDYIYAAIAEEFGLLGGAVLFLALIILVNAGVRTAIDARDMFSKLCAAGFTAFIGLQALVNTGGVLRALPMTGITLPFVSHGGFSLITSFAMLGLLMAFSHRNAKDSEAFNRQAVISRPVPQAEERPAVLEAVE
ncbi:MAG: FtsW/RodA/SpoVE family cell cycle protein [Pyrinomonadaceae bacterium MAG19_C2-C3]|nr:FtsW/RodA/SpoVE family cell cycle protein [Pyrinomonadaceae bacterium MAG19_C2-C3]